MKKVFIAVLAVVLVFGITATALADGGFYYGAMSSGFTCSQTFNKVNDQTIEDDNVSSRVGSYTSSISTDYRSKLMVAGDVKANCIVGDGGYNKWTGSSKG